MLQLTNGQVFYATVFSYAQILPLATIDTHQLGIEVRIPACLNKILLKIAKGAGPSTPEIAIITVAGSGVCTSMSTAERFKARRAAIDISLPKLAARVQTFLPGLDFSDLSKIERGERAVKAEELPVLAWALECQVSDLVDDPPDVPLPDRGGSSDD